MTAAVQQRAPAPAQPERTEPDDQWRAKADSIVAEAQHALFHADRDGAEYLDRRGLEPGTWQAFGWGFQNQRKRQCSFCRKPAVRGAPSSGRLLLGENEEWQFRLAGRPDFERPIAGGAERFVVVDLGDEARVRDP